MRHELTSADREGASLLVLPHVDPSRGRRNVAVGPGTSIAAMVDVAFPVLSSSQMRSVRVVIGDSYIPQAVWHRVKPKPGVTVVVRVIPEGDGLKSVLSIAVLVAAVALGQYYAPAIAGAVLPTGFAATASTLSILGSAATATFAVAGSLLLNSLIPTRGLGDDSKGTDVYAITGIQNSANPGGVIPSVLGRHRYAPPFAMASYTEIIGDDLYFTCAFLLGHGPLNITNHRLGDTPIESFDDYSLQVRQGFPDDPPLTLVPQQVIETPLTLQLKGGSPIVQRTAKDATECSVDITFVQGLVEYNDKGEGGWKSVEFIVEQRKVGDANFTSVGGLTASSNLQRILRRTYRWTFPTRGQYDVRLTRVTGDSEDTKVIDRSDWSTIRSFRPESPFNFNRPVALVALRIRSSNQLNGVINNYNADVALLCSDYNPSTGLWTTGETSNPASLARHVMQGPANAYPKTDGELDLPKLQAWHQFCAARGLTYNRVHDYDASRLEVLADVAGAGRATPHDDGVKWGVTIDRPQSTYVAAISPRNSWDFEGTTPQVQFPDGHRVQFIDATNGHQQAERIIPFPGVSPDAVAVTEDMSHPGITDPSLIWLETRRRQYELIYRPHTYTVSQDIESMVLTRGDLAALSHDVLDRDHVPARVRMVDGNDVVIDTPVSMDAGRAYACGFRFRNGESVRRSVVTVPGETTRLKLIGDVSGIEVGNLAWFGTSLRGPEIDVIVKSIERGENLTAKLTLVDAAPIIDELVAAEIPPPWNGRVGEEVDVSEIVPAVPNFELSDEGLVLRFVLLPGSGSIAVPTSYRVFYRALGGGAFTLVTVPATEGVAFISGFIGGDVVEVKASAVSAYGIPSAETPVQQWTMTVVTPTAPTADSSSAKADMTFLTADHF